VITYAYDVAPHFQRQMLYRRLRLQRRQVLHPRTLDIFGDYHPYDWLETASVSQLLHWIFGVFLVGVMPRAR
jgi:hypothetical protein